MHSEKTESGVDEQMKNIQKKNRPSAGRYFLAAVLLCLAIVFAAVGFWWRCQSNGDERQQAKEEAEQTALYTEIRPEQGMDPLKKAQLVNPQVTAWITIPDTSMDYPVVQGDDNEYYLNHDLEGASSVLGVPFLDIRCDSDFSGFNSIIYGHHIKKERIFTPLTHFGEAEYFDAHESGWLITDTENYRIHFIACLILENGDFIYQTDFRTEEEKEMFLQNIKEKAVQIRDFEIGELIDRQFVTLSTCSYEFENARTVLIGYLESQTR
jgi:sortase B